MRGAGDGGVWGRERMEVPLVGARPREMVQQYGVDGAPQCLAPLVGGARDRFSAAQVPAPFSFGLFLLCLTKRIADYKGLFFKKFDYNEAVWAT
jgi:hypothetical protein